MSTGRRETPATAATAHLYWDQMWKTEQARARWSDPDEWVAAWVPLLRERGGRRVLDLGCGPGRHAVLFAQAGFETHGIDGSSDAIRHAAAAAEAAGVTLTLRQGDLVTLPYPGQFFDYVLAFNVVYHGTEETLARTLSEVRRVLRPGGLYQCTMLSKRSTEYRRGTEIAPNSYVQPLGRGDKVHPHLYTDARDVVRLHAGFDLLAASDRDQTGAGEYHWYCLFETC